MKKIITLATAGFLLLNLQVVQAQREVAPPPIPPMLEDEKPLVQPQPRQITAPKTTKKKAKTRVKGKSKKASRKSAKKGKKKTTVKKKKHHKSSKVAKKKSRKSHKKKSPATAPKRQSGPQEG
jgi:hypothetical protein